MKSSVARCVSNLVAAVAVAGCASTNGDGFGGWVDVESVDGGKRLRVEGLFEVTAPIAVDTDGGIVFESTSSRRDVVFIDRLEGSPDDPRREFVGSEFS